MGNEQTPPVDTPPETPAESTPPEIDAEKLKSDLAAKAAELEKAKQILAAQDAETREREAKAREAHEATLREQKKYKELAEIKTKELFEERDKRRKQAEAVTKTFKLQAKREHALKAGIRDEALDDLEWFPDDELEIRTSESGAIDVAGADRWVENLRTSKPYLFKSSTAPNISGGRPSSQTPTAKKVNWVELQKTDPEAYEQQMREAIKSSGIQIK